MIFYILSMEQSSDREGHHYNCGLFNDLADATVEGMEHELFRAGKYEMRIELCKLNENVLKEIPREVAINYAILKYPQKFNDKKQLLEEE